MAKKLTATTNLRAVVDSMGTGFCVVEILLDGAGRPADYRFLDVNAAFEAQTGLRDAVGRTALELVPGLERSWVRLYGDVALTGRPARFTQGSAPMGRVFDVRAFRVGDPGLRHVAIIFEDTTERQRAEAALRASQDRQAFQLRLADALRPLGDAREVLTTAARLLRGQLGADRVLYAEDTGDGQTVRVMRGDERTGLPSLEGIYRYADYGPDLLREMRAGRAVLRPDIARDPLLTADEKAAHAALGLGAVLNVPLVKDGRLLAVLAVHYGEPHAFEAEEVALAQEVAERTWAAAERARAEAGLRDSEARYRTLFETIDEGFCVIEFLDGPSGPLSDYLHVEANPAYSRHAGISDAVGRRGRELLAPEEAEGWVELFRRVLVTGEPVRFERVLEVTGRHLEVAAFRVEPASRRQVAALFQDVTDRVRAEEALKALAGNLERRVAERTAEREVLARIVETTGASVQALDLDYRWTAINEAAAEAYESLYGARPALGGSLRDLLARWPDEWAAAKAMWDRALGGEAFSETAEWGAPEVGRHVYKMRFEVLKARDGRVAGAFLTGLDVTDRVEAQARLAEAEEARRKSDALYRAFFENSPEALFVIGVVPDGGFVVEEVNPAHEAGVGFRGEEIRGRRVEEFLPPQLAEQVLAHYCRAAQTGETEHWREVFELRGEAQHWDSSLVPIRGPDGRVVRLIGSSRNVTRQVVTEEALRQSQKMEAMGSLTGGVAHDFNNLLTPIVAVLDRLRRRPLGTEREQRLIEGAAQSAERARTLVQRLLAFARRQPLQPMAVDVAALVRGMADLVASTTGPQIRVVIEVEPDLPPAKADPNQLEMAILNLAVNARDAMPREGTLRLGARAEEAGGREAARLGLRPGRYLRLSVADTGSGMDEATLARAVEPFFSTKGVGKGTGLGLSMVHGLASQLGGALEIRSRPGLGTTVDLWLPESEEPLEAAPPAPAPEPLRGWGAALLVDDEATVRLSTADMLGEMGYRVLEAASAEDALQLVEEETPLDLLVTDHLMPGMSGSDLARRVRSLRPGLPVLIISGYAETEGIEPDLPRLTKPFRKDELLAALSGLMAARPS